MEIEKALHFMCEEAKRQGADAYDVVAGESESLAVEIFEKKIKNTDISNSRGIGIRVFKDQRPGFAFTERVTESSLQQTVRDAISHSDLTDTLELDLPDNTIPEGPDLELYNSELEGLSFDDMKELGLKIEDLAQGGDARVENIPYLGVSRSLGNTYFENSKGIFYQVKGSSVSAYAGVVAKEGESKKMGVYSNGGRRLDLSVLKPELIAGRAVKRAVELLGASPAKGGEIPVLLSNRVSGRLISMFGSPFFAESVQKGQSRLEGKLNETIASSLVNLSCQPHIPGAPGSRLLDGEGVVTSPRDVIKDGKLLSFLYNLEAARKDGVQTTGNSTRSYMGRVGTGFTNMIMEKGDSTLEEMLAMYPRILYVTKLEGGSGCSATSGEISIGVQGFIYENGKEIQPVDNMTISSNYFDLLKNIKALSNEYSDAFSSVKVPAILIDSMHVAA